MRATSAGLCCALTIATLTSFLRPPCPYDRSARATAYERHREADAAQFNPPILRFSDGERRITLIGTFHVLPERYDDPDTVLPRSIREEVDSADILLVESNLMTAEPHDAIIHATQVARRKEQADPDKGRPGLGEYLSARDPELPEAFATAAAKRFGSLRRFEANGLLDLRPWAARDRLRDLTIRNADAAAEWSAGLDLHLVRAAREAGTDVAHLETWEEFARLKDGGNQKHAVAESLFVSLGNGGGHCIAMARSYRLLRLFERWSSDNLDDLNTLSELYGFPYDALGIPVPAGVRAGWAAEERLLFETRERKWVGRIGSMIGERDASSVVVAVGAAHVAGELTVLPQLLEEAGYAQFNDEIRAQWVKLLRYARRSHRRSLYIGGR